MAQVGEAIPGMIAVSQTAIFQRDGLAAGSGWANVGDATRIIGLAGFQNKLYGVAGNRLWVRGAIGPGTGDTWSVVGEAYRVVAMAAHQGQLYVVSNNKLWRRGKIGPDTGNDWIYSGDAAGITSLASFNGHLYATNRAKLLQRGSIGAGTGNDWKAVGDAIGVKAMSAYQGNLYAIVDNMLLRRGAIGTGSGNDWTPVADATDLTALTIVPVTSVPVATQPLPITFGLTDCIDPDVGALSDPPVLNCPLGSVLSIVAHEDDDIYFINPTIQQAIAAGKCTRTIFVVYGGTARGVGAMAAHSYMAGFNIPQPPPPSDPRLLTLPWINLSLAQTLLAPDQPEQPAQVRTLVVIPGSGNPVLNNRVSIVNLKMRNQSNLSGLLEPLTKEVLCEKRPDNSVPPQIDRPSSKAIVRDRLIALMNDFSPTEIHTLNPDATDFNEHPDHVQVARVVREAAAALPSNVPIYYHETYPTAARKANVSPGLLQKKQGALSAFFNYQTSAGNGERHQYTYDPYFTNQEPKNYFRFALAHNPPTTPHLEGVKLYNLLTGTCVDTGDGLDNTVKLAACNDSPSQQFVFTPGSSPSPNQPQPTNPFGQTVVTNTGKCLQWPQQINGRVTQELCAPTAVDQFNWTKADFGRIMQDALRPERAPLNSKRGNCLAVDTLDGKEAVTVIPCNQKVNSHWALTDDSSFNDPRQEMQALADFDGDGKDDILVADRPRNNNLAVKPGEIDYYVGAGVLFKALLAYPIGQQPIFSDPVVYANEGGEDYAPLLHTSIEHDAMRFVVGDFNGPDFIDGKHYADLVVAERDKLTGKANLWFYPNIDNGAGGRTFGVRQNWSTQFNFPYDNIRLKAGDFNGDQVADLLVMQKRGNRASYDLNVLLSLTNQFAEPQLWYDATGTVIKFDDTRIAIGDIDNDNLSDVALIEKMATGGTNIRVYRNQSAQQFALPRLNNRLQASSYGNLKFALGDVNGDQRADIVTFEKHKDDGGFDVRVLRNQLVNNIPIFTAPVLAANLPTPATDPIYYLHMEPAVGDINSDGKADIVLAKSRIDSTPDFFQWLAGKAQFRLMTGNGTSFVLDSTAKTTDMEFDWLRWFSTVPATSGTGSPY